MRVQLNLKKAAIPGFVLILLTFLLPSHQVKAQEGSRFPSQPLQGEADYSTLMVDGITRFMDRELALSSEKRLSKWTPDFSSKTAYVQSVADNRRRFGQMIGAVDEINSDIEMQYKVTGGNPEKVAENDRFIAYAVQWEVFAGVHGEGLLLQPKGVVKGRIVAIPDADQTPEMLIGTSPGIPKNGQYARILAENGCQVMIPTIVSRKVAGSGSERMGRFTNQPHREWIYRQAYTFGRHIIGYEVQKIIAAVDWMANQNEQSPLKIGVLGWGEGALLGLYSAALDERIDVALVSGYFSDRTKVWEEPIYRNVAGLLTEFGDADIARLILPRTLMIEYATAPEVKGPPDPLPGAPRLGASAAPGALTIADFKTVEEEVAKAKQRTGPFHTSLHFIHADEKPLQPLSISSIQAFLEQVQPGAVQLSTSQKELKELRKDFDPVARQLRQVKELETYTQGLIEKSRHVRDDFFWDNMKITDADSWEENKQHYQDYLWDKVIGRISADPVPSNPRSRQIFDKASWTGHEVVLDASEDIIVWGYLLIPKNIKEGEKRPTIVVKHGGGGVPAVVVDKSNKTYKGLATQLVEQGFVVFAPHFPWKGGDSYRSLQRRANPLSLSVFSVILHQHDKMLDWLTSLSFVDPGRIGMYGLSWGGKVAVRVPALLDRYALSVCSGDFNEWIWKNATTDWPNSYMFVPEYEMFDFNLASTFNYGEMAALIAPRAFMVERGHDDGVGIDEWVAFEYAKVNRLYNKLNIPEKTAIEYFDGGHEINAEGTIKFIKQQFDWP